MSFEFWQQAFQAYMSNPYAWMEIAASALLIANVWLLARNSTWNYLPGILGTLIYGFLFFEYKLYSDSILQIGYFIPIQIIGWYMWNKGDKGLADPSILSLNTTNKLVAVAVVAAFTSMIGSLMFKFTDASFPYFDSFILAASIVANFLLVRRIWDNWILWIAVDVVAIPLYWVKEMYITSALYVVFLGLATYGFYIWSKQLKD